MEPITRNELQELYPQQLQRQREIQIRKTAEEIYRTVKRLASAGFFEYKYTSFTETRELLPFVVERLQEVLVGIDIFLEPTFYKDRGTQRLVEVKESSIRIVWN
jgi:hypothetical protein